MLVLARVCASTFFTTAFADLGRRAARQDDNIIVGSQRASELGIRNSRMLIDLAQGRPVERGRIVRQSPESGAQRLLDKSRGGVLGFADRQLDLAQIRIRRDAGKSLAQFFKRAGYSRASLGFTGAKA